MSVGGWVRVFRPCGCGGGVSLFPGLPQECPLYPQSLTLSFSINSQAQLDDDAKPAEVMQQLGAMWKALSEKHKKPYKDKVGGCV